MKPRKLKSGTWFVQAQVSGVRRSFSAHTRAEVMRKAMSYKVSPVQTLSEPLGDVLDRYIDSKQNILSPATITRYRMTRRREFQSLMQIPVRDLTSELIQAEVNIMAMTKSPKTVRNDYGLIRAALRVYAPELRLRITLPAKKQPVYHIPTTEQVYALIDEASDNMKTAIMLAAFCGLRRGEIAALEYDDINGSLLHVKASRVLEEGKYEVTKSPKTFTSDRYIPIPNFVLSHILRNRTDTRVCPITLNYMTHNFIILRNRLGLNCRFHDLRHYYASACHAIGVPDQYIMRFGGWKSDGVLKSIYRGILDDFEVQSAQKIVDYFSGANRMLTRKLGTRKPPDSSGPVRAPSRPLHTGDV